MIKLVNLIGKIGFIVVGFVFFIFFIKDVVLYFDFGVLNGWYDWLLVLECILKYFMMVVILIVVVVFEGLFMSVIFSLVLNMCCMFVINNLVCKMYVCEIMGVIIVICIDKIGMLI